jgi:hypothetical protein
VFRTGNKQTARAQTPAGRGRHVTWRAVQGNRKLRQHPRWP